MMGMDDVRSRHRAEQTGGDGMRRVSTQPAQGAQRAALQAARFAFDVWQATEADQLALDARATGERPRELERVAFAAAE